MAAAQDDTVVMLRHESSGAVKTRIEAVKPLPMLHERLQCRCGNTHFFVTKVDFVCTNCDKSYRD